MRGECGLGGVCRGATKSIATDAYWTGASTTNSHKPSTARKLTVNTTPRSRTLRVNICTALCKMRPATKIQCRRHVTRLRLQQKQAGDMEEQRPLKLVGQVRTEARLQVRPRVAAIRAAAEAPHGRSARYGEQGIEKGGECDVRGHGEDQRVWHKRNINGSWSPPHLNS